MKRAMWSGVAALAVLAGGCGDDDAVVTDAGPSDAAVPEVDAGMDAGPPIPRVDDRPTLAAGNAVAPGDPLFEGQQRFLWDAFGTERLDSWPPADFMLSLMTSEPAVFGNQYESFGFVRDPSDDFPVGFKRGLEDPTKVHETCAACHTARLPDGTLWFGAPNTALDFERFRVEVSRRWVSAGHPALLTDLAISKAMQLGPGRTGAESRDYPNPVPTDFPVYYRLSTRHHMNYMGTGNDVRTEAHFSIFTFGAGSPNAREAIVPFPPEGRTVPFVAFLGSLTSPPAPPQDAALVSAGAAVFVRARCDTCHHVDDLGLDEVVTLDRAAGALEHYPGDDMAFPRGSIRTDAQHRVLQDGDPTMDGGAGVDTGLADLIAFIVRNRLSVSMTDGYRTSDLHGLWQSAPYLHNGSVPTLDALLEPAAMRPTTFMRGTFVVDVTATGNGNAGHEFGTELSATDKVALVAYLLSL